MGTMLNSFDFSRHKQAMRSRGFSQEECEASWSDLQIILDAIEESPEKSFALTLGADNALHELVQDTIGLLRVSGALLGAGNVLAHDPFCYGTPEFDRGWANTCAAFAVHGIRLPLDYRSAGTEDFRSANTCLVSKAAIPDIQLAA